MAAIKAGVVTTTTKAELERCERRQAALQATLESQAAASCDVSDFLPRALDRYAGLVANLETAVQYDVPRARTQIQALLGSEIRLSPTAEGHLEAEMTGDYAGLVALIKQNPGQPAGARKLSLVAGVGFEPTTFRL